MPKPPNGMAIKSHKLERVWGGSDTYIPEKVWIFLSLNGGECFV
jgi:hypothetical protein